MAVFQGSRAVGSNVARCLGDTSRVLINSNRVTCMRECDAESLNDPIHVTEGAVASEDAFKHLIPYNMSSNAKTTLKFLNN